MLWHFLALPLLCVHVAINGFVITYGNYIAIIVTNIISTWKRENIKMSNEF